MEYLDVNS